MRRFELTIGVFLGDDEPLPETFRDWIDVAGLNYEGASPTTLERVIETAHPPKEDVIEKRKSTRRWSRSPW
jgi:hypothetical protein